jgi:hypothetical protein
MGSKKSDGTTLLLNYLKLLILISLGMPSNAEKGNNLLYLGGLTCEIPMLKQIDPGRKKMISK